MQVHTPASHQSLGYLRVYQRCSNTCSLSIPSRQSRDQTKWGESSYFRVIWRDAASVRFGIRIESLQPGIRLSGVAYVELRPCHKPGLACSRCYSLSSISTPQPFENHRRCQALLFYDRHVDPVSIAGGLASRTSQSALTRISDFVPTPLQ